MARRTAQQAYSYREADERIERIDRREAARAEATPIRATLQEVPKLANYQTWHAISRARQRYDVTVTVAQLDAFSEGMRAGKAVPGAVRMGSMDEYGKRGDVWLVIVDDVEMPAVFDVDTGRVVTFLPDYARVLEFKDGRFLHLANGGTRVAREYWKATRA